MKERTASDGQSCEYCGFGPAVCDCCAGCITAFSAHCENCDSCDCHGC